MKDNSSTSSTQANHLHHNIVIEITRVLSMLMIIGCHLSSWFGINALAMLLNVGVYTFLIISGTLYSNKNIDNSLSFLKRRWCKLCIPMYILSFFLLIYNICVSNYSALKSIPTYLLNLQGLSFLFHRANPPQMLGLGHLWFLTAIMLCYFLLVIVKKVEHQISSSVAKKWLAILCVLDIVFAYAARIQLHYFIAFFLGYYFGKFRKKLSLHQYILLTLSMVLALTGRLFAKANLDDTITYNSIIVSFSHIILAVWIYKTIEYFCKIMPEAAHQIADNGVVKCVESLSMYIYMTHYMFLVGPFYVDSLPCSKVVQLLVFAAATLFSACLLKWISEKIGQLFNRLFP